MKIVIMQNFNSAVQEYRGDFIDSYLRKWLRAIADDLVLKLITESIYKKMMSKILKRMVYSVIQSSVESYQTLEDNTLFLAERVLDGYVKGSLDLLISEEVVLSKNSLLLQDDLVNALLRQELKQMIEDSLFVELNGDRSPGGFQMVQRLIASKQLESEEHNDEPLYTTMPGIQREQLHSPIETRRVMDEYEEGKSTNAETHKEGQLQKVNCFKRASLSSKPDLQRKQNEGFSEMKQWNQKELAVRGSDLIRVDDFSGQMQQERGNPFASDKSLIERNQMESNSSSLPSSDADMFSDQDEGKVSQQPDGLEDDSLPQSFMSPSKRPDFRRNILSSQKSVSSSMQFNPNSLSSRQQMPRISTEKVTASKQNRNFKSQLTDPQHLKSYDESHRVQKSNHKAKIFVHAQPETFKNVTQRSYHSRSGSSDLEVKALKFSKQNQYFREPESKNAVQSQASQRGSAHGKENLDLTSAFDFTHQVMPAFSAMNQPKTLQNQMAQLETENYTPGITLREYTNNVEERPKSNRLLGFNNTTTLLNFQKLTHERQHSSSVVSAGFPPATNGDSSLSVQSLVQGNQTQKLGLQKQGSGQNLLIQNLRSGGMSKFNNTHSSAGNLSLTQTCTQGMMKPHMGSLIRNGTAKVISQMQPSSCLNHFKQRYSNQEQSQEQRDDDEVTPNDGVGSSFVNDREDYSDLAEANMVGCQRAQLEQRRNTDSTESPTARYPPQQINQMALPVKLLENFSVTSSVASQNFKEEILNQKQQRLVSNKSQGCLQKNDPRQANQDRYKFEVTAKMCLDQNSSSNNESFFSAHSSIQKINQRQQAESQLDRSKKQPPIVIQPHMYLKEGKGFEKSKSIDQSLQNTSAVGIVEAAANGTSQLRVEDIQSAKKFHQQRLFQKSREYQAKREQEIQKSQQKRSSQLLGSPTSALSQAIPSAANTSSTQQQQQQAPQSNKSLQSYMLKPSANAGSSTVSRVEQKLKKISTPQSAGIYQQQKVIQNKNQTGQAKDQREYSADSEDSEEESYGYIFREEKSKNQNKQQQVARTAEVMNADYDTKVQDYESTGDFNHFQDTQFMEKSPVSNLQSMAIKQASEKGTMQTQLKQRLDAQIKEAKKRVEKSYYLSSVERKKKTSSATANPAYSKAQSATEAQAQANQSQGSVSISKEPASKERVSDKQPKNNYNLPLQMDLRKDRSESNLGFNAVRAINQQSQPHTHKQGSTKRVGDVIAQQPKEGFKFIEQKVQQQLQLQHQYSLNQNYPSATESLRNFQSQHSSTHSQQFNHQSSLTQEQQNHKLQHNHLPSYASQLHPSSKNGSVSVFNDQSSQQIEQSKNAQAVKTICVELQSTSNDGATNNSAYNTKDSMSQYNPLKANQQNSSQFETFAKALMHKNSDSKILQNQNTQLVQKSNSVASNRVAPIRHRESLASQGNASFEYFNDNSAKNLHEQYSSIGSIHQIQQKKSVGDGVLATYNTRLSIGGAIHKQASMQEETKESQKLQLNEASSQSSSSTQFKSVFAKAREMTKFQQVQSYGVDEGANSTQQEKNADMPQQINKPAAEGRESDLLQEQSINLQVEKLIVTLKTKQQEIKRSNSKSSQLQALESLVKMAQKIAECSKDVEPLFEIDQQLKVCLVELSNGKKHQQESFSVVILTNQLALLNYQKLGCLVEKKQQVRNSHLVTQVESSTPKGVHSGIQFKARNDRPKQPSKVNGSAASSHSLQSQKLYEVKSVERKHEPRSMISDNKLSYITSTSSIQNSMVSAPQVIRDQTYTNKMSSAERQTSLQQCAEKKGTKHKHQLHSGGVPQRHLFSDKQVDQPKLLDGAVVGQLGNTSVSGFSLGNVMANRMRSGTAYGLLEKSNAPKESTSSVGRVTVSKNSTNGLIQKQLTNQQSNASAQKQAAQTINLKNLHQRDLQFISKYIGKLDAQANLPISALTHTANSQILDQQPSSAQFNANLLAQNVAQTKISQQPVQAQAAQSTLDFQKKQFYVMALNQYGARLKSLGVQNASTQICIEEVFNKARAKKVQPKDWREFISFALKAME